jgi:methyltransferase (TIGR00027 family)
VTEPGPIRNISDTARWIAYYRAMETERPDALFKDPYARELAGERGEAIVRTLPRGRSSAWPLIVRTAVLDELIQKAVRELGAQAVVNLAAGLDTRPYRMDLPAGLQWVEVDLPEMVDYKEARLSRETPRCRLERVRLDLADAAARGRLLDRLAAAGVPTLVVTEGLLVYLEEAQVASLAEDLRSRASFRWWLLDNASPQLLAMLKKTWGPVLKAGNSEMKFAPVEGSAYYAAHGWRVREERFTIVEARRLRREMPLAWIWRILGLFLSAKTKEMYRRFSSYVLLEKA